MSNGEKAIWTIAPATTPRDGAIECCLRLKKERLVRIKPIATDAAAMLVSAFDHVAAACARLTTPELMQQNLNSEQELFQPH